MSDTSDISKTLTERESQHGAFMNQAAISQALSEVMRRAKNYQNLTPYMRESLEMIQTKIARILEGNPHNTDHWHDIAGYATLVERTLLQERERLTAKPAAVTTAWTEWTKAERLRERKP